MKKLTVAALAVTTLSLAVPMRMKQANFLCVQGLQPYVQQKVLVVR